MAEVTRKHLEIAEDVSECEVYEIDERIAQALADIEAEALAAAPQPVKAEDEREPWIPWAGSWVSFDGDEPEMV